MNQMKSTSAEKIWESQKERYQRLRKLIEDHFSTSTESSRIQFSESPAVDKSSFESDNSETTTTTTTEELIPAEALSLLQWYRSFHVTNEAVDSLLKILSDNKFDIQKVPTSLWKLRKYEAEIFQEEISNRKSFETTRNQKQRY